MPRPAPPYQSAALPVRVTVHAQAHHLPQYSRPEGQCFAYVVRLENEDDQTWRLISRYWLITDSKGRCTEVEGEGVVGQQPLLAAGAVFVYDSFVTVPDAPARMAGHYIMENAWGERCQVEISAFRLVVDERLLN
ncbi:Co2+/Mg2+ efflux protein ApaG [Deinococcus radiophilus]|uniref:Co2+/Mg2+ efflux protein ApaG n=2 Tax=Deinococcus radiophilus TaxID=32062 RepID=A0A3S0KEY8_9DEIO|nr:Co2+/Mg2+ efflux protein ApaG [Deinococcus radiophilus]RTR25236.1 Co2+/Mg2+ efflux protein ApaG [Deinococcus radiophilus]